MAGYGSQTNYEADLLATYLRKGRVSPIAKRDVDLALSIYKMPKSKTNYKDLKTLTYATARKAAKGKDDATVMRMATTAVLNKNIDARKQKAAAKAAAAKQAAAAKAAAAKPAARPVTAVPATRAATAYRPATSPVARPVTSSPGRVTYPRTTTTAPVRRVSAPTTSTVGVRTYTPPKPRRTYSSGGARPI